MMNDVSRPVIDNIGIMACFKYITLSLSEIGILYNSNPSNPLIIKNVVLCGRGFD